MTQVTVVKVPMAVSWPCDLCDKEPVVAYIVTDEEETFGYCTGHLGPAVLAALFTREPGFDINIYNHKRD